MKPLTHKNCLGARGIKSFKCKHCGNDSQNYMNGLDVCRKCCEKASICEICGKSLIDVDKEKLSNTKSSVEIRLFDHNSNKAIYKVLTINEVKQILDILGTDFSEGI